MYALIVHGGAGNWKKSLEAAALEGLRQAVTAGALVLAKGGSALDAVVVVVTLLEDDPTFNAGTGSALNLVGEAEMDAGVMVGRGLKTGNVTCLKRVRNPIQVARKVMEETDHVILSGEGALQFARLMGFPDYNPVTEQRNRDWQEKRKALGHAKHPDLPRLSRLVRRHTEFGGGTVGAVALDARGRLAAATSTGGVTLKLPGRVGDSPVPGAGNYATPAGGVSATGKGELMLRYLTAKAVCDRMGGGRTAQQAVDLVLAAMAREVGGDAGVIALDAEGRLGVGHGTPAMPHALITEAAPRVVARMRVPRRRG